MAYDTSVAVPNLLTQSVAGKKIWSYSSADAVSAVRVSGYFTDGWDRGMRAGDLIYVEDNDASPRTGSLCWVTSATSSAVDLSDGVTITGTDSD